jgi:hypothetical protein
MLTAWGSYRLEDFILFGPETYWRLFALENAALWPLPVIVLVAGLVLAFLLFVRHGALPARAGALMMACVWAWVGWHFVGERYGSINWAAESFAWLFFVQAALLVAFAVAGWIPVLLHPGGAARRMAGVAVAASAVVYPLFAPIDGRPIATAEVLGIAPDPTVAASLGLMILLPRNWAALALHALPATWMGLSALTLHGLGNSWQGAATLAIWAVLFAAWLKASARPL